MNKFLDSSLTLSFNSRSNYYRDDYYDRDDDYYYPPPERRRPPMPPRRRHDEPRRSNSGWEPGYYKSDKASKKLKDPKNSSRFIFNFFKIITQVFLVLTGLAFVVASVCYMLIGILNKDQLNTLNQNYFTDILAVSWTFGSMLGILTGVLFLVLFILMIINRRGWLRKNNMKTYISWFLTFTILSLISVYFLFVSSSGLWAGIKTQLSFKDSSIQNIILTIWKPIVTFMDGNSFISKIVSHFYSNKLGIIGSGAVFLVIDIAIIIFGSFYFKSINSILEDSFEYFEDRKRRY